MTRKKKTKEVEKEEVIETYSEENPMTKNVNDNGVQEEVKEGE